MLSAKSALDQIPEFVPKSHHLDGRHGTRSLGRVLSTEQETFSGMSGHRIHGLVRGQCLGKVQTHRYGDMENSPRPKHGGQIIQCIRSYPLGNYP